ncbi:nucleotidyltransferase domain-containing protein [Haloplasma contractile]|uniref:Glycerophosphoryl diester phosphodiesterase protein n=1 Tax=Haloplasma contractile SSD-17B TaxID=1033810 RepID=U2FD23_9MOLU|nr:nucleotidyltransferase domain-containing protein [Haloplasma contractile]ERJ10910.1 glycerophosphoryl diester phosphodiesterase protein [Haloplasma contractile SSD-17B]
MEDKKKIIDLIKRKVETEYKDDVAILAVYGSYARGTHDEKSDIDLFYVPKTERANSLSFQFIIEGIGYDLFPISFERLVRIAAFDQPLTAVITESKVLYFATDEDLERYESYRKSIFTMLKDTDGTLMLNKSYEYFNETYIYLYNMKYEVENLIDQCIESSKIISKIVMSVALANKTFYKGGMGTNIKDSFKLNQLPTDYKSLIDRIIGANERDELLDSCETLIKNTRQFLLDQRIISKEREPYNPFFVGYYEELKSVINKMIRACEEQDQYSAFLIASYFHEEVAQFLTKAEEGIWYDDRNYYGEYSKCFDKLIGVNLMEFVTKKEFSLLKEAVLKFETNLVNLLLEKEVPMNVYDSIDEFERDYKKR